MMLPTTTVGAPTSLGKWYCVGRRTAADRRRHSRAVGPYTWGPAGYPSLARVGQVHAVFMVSRNIDARLDFQRKSLVSLYADFSVIIRMMSYDNLRTHTTNPSISVWHCFHCQSTSQKLQINTVPTPTMAWQEHLCINRAIHPTEPTRPFIWRCPRCFWWSYAVICHNVNP